MINSVATNTLLISNRFGDVWGGQLWVLLRFSYSPTVTVDLKLKRMLLKCHKKTSLHDLRWSKKLFKST